MFEICMYVLLLLFPKLSDFLINNQPLVPATFFTLPFTVIFYIQMINFILVLQYSWGGTTLLICYKANAQILTEELVL